ncbi:MULTISPECIES: DUF4232 domain-containing protein [unclassified Streptomyces]|uniref:DUF4232 domain-containing protein n=1 Tax=unclassified Streptomyces TaxID=2593676 RepID=UPI002E19D7BA|nr:MULTISPECIES: DUF4232 domain-containing protein [unclassified Streptomyces]
MKYTRISAFAAIGVAATLSLTACGGGDSDASAKDSSATSSSSSSDSGSKAEAGDAKTGSGSDTEVKAGAANSGTQSGTKATFCKTEDLAINAVDAAPDETSGRIDISMVNRGSTTCSATGFAGVDIKDKDNTSNPIERGHAEPRVTTLKPGDSAIFNLSYDIDSSGESLSSPTNIVVTPPNETHSVTLDWPAGAGDIKGAYTDVQVYPTHTTK